MAVGAVGELHDGDDLAAPPLAGPADHDDVVHAGWPAMARSTSSTKIFSPPELIVTESRPSSSIWPSSGNTLARSPGTDYRTPSITGNVRAVFASSPRYPRGMQVRVAPAIRCPRTRLEHPVEVLDDDDRARTAG